MSNGIFSSSSPFVPAVSATGPIAVKASSGSGTAVEASSATGIGVRAIIHGRERSVGGGGRRRGVCSGANRVHADLAKDRDLLASVGVGVHVVGQGANS